MSDDGNKKSLKWRAISDKDPVHFQTFGIFYRKRFKNLIFAVYYTLYAFSASSLILCELNAHVIFLPLDTSSSNMVTSVFFEHYLSFVSGLNTLL